MAKKVDAAEFLRRQREADPPVRDHSLHPGASRVQPLRWDHGHKAMLFGRTAGGGPSSWPTRSRTWRP